MGWDSPDMYYNPEKFGLKIVFTDDSDAYYGFDMFVVWQDEAGNYYVGADSGCSCPTPFETWTDLKDVPVSTPKEVHEAYQEWLARNSEREDGDGFGKAELMEKVR